MLIEKEQKDYSWEVLDAEDAFGLRTKMKDSSRHEIVYRNLIKGRVLSKLTASLLLFFVLSYGFVRMYDWLFIMNEKQRAAEDILRFGIIFGVAFVVSLLGILARIKLCHIAFSNRRNYTIMAIGHALYGILAATFAIITVVLNDRLWAASTAVMAIVVVLVSFGAMVKFFNASGVDAEARRVRIQNELEEVMQQEEKKKEEAKERHGSVPLNKGKDNRY